MAAIPNLPLQLDFSKSFWTSERFDLAITALAAASFWLPHAGAGTLLVQGLRSFACVNLADRVFQRIFLEVREKKGGPLLQGSIHALIEQGIYAGILQTTSPIWALPRFAVSLILGATAVRSLDPSSIALAFGISRDNRWGFVWAIFREIASFFAPVKYSVPLLLAADSLISGFCEVCPLKGKLSLIQYETEWIYKVFSRTVFQGIANLLAIRMGFVSSLVQHLLFNFSRSFPSRISL